MKILLTGVAGFIASKTAELLLEDGHEVVGLDNMNDYYDVSLKEHRLEFFKDKENFQFHEVDIENFGELEKIFSKHKFDAVLNLAARAGVRYSIENPHVYMSTNAQGSLNILELMKKHDVKKYVLASTSSLYAGLPMPFKEDLPVNTPISPYAATKKAAESMAYTYHHLFGIDVSIVRYFTVYGPASRPDMAQFRFMRWIDEGSPIQLYGDGTQARDFTYVDDIARGTILAMKPLGYEIINLGGGKNPITVNEMISILENELGKDAKVENLPFNKADMKETWADITKAKTLLGWEPTINLNEGLRLCVESYKNNFEIQSKVSLN
ncbi:MAG: nucleotide sugar epimerase [Halobacteriovoraceae bacterium]|nr:nucleotide sugar epimerase [Halobacteriovoraceae bacterium]|tara:strand:- start:99886 stop:100857 length:972 start_codon:yes stop_codon:yes gene_type:complete